MERKSQILILFFVTVAAISLAGFFNSYIRFLPDDMDRFPLVIHVHFSAFACWFALLIVQPILIKQEKYSLHRKIGKLSYFIAPVLVVTILILVTGQTKKDIVISEERAAFTAFVGLLDAVSFSAYYLIAMTNKRNLRWHVAFIIAATLIILNPGMSRLLNHIKPGLGLPAAVFLPFIISIGIILIEKIKFRRPVLKSPYFLFFCCWTVEILLLVTIPKTEFWHLIVKKLLGIT
ncbi:hypothetical protein [Flavobacterium lindanitolerans]|uniref:hypothetical protein n=1 Tax=Flavobacterium lindanitolerans TaxID=428988 RepID=UPI001220B34F|nr:hypothetical protein [Flavobacterium lindanitolerans]MDQ7960904.1 hypothetical protein [Flavobacterium lindanitolerans]THD31865.1 MAG: hypothetical protein DI588_09690 [Flavobacterium johnsoniae]